MVICSDLADASVTHDSAHSLLYRPSPLVVLGFSFISYHFLPLMSPSTMDPQADTDIQAATFSDRMSVNGVEARRSKHAPISKGVAAHASSDMFKTPVGTMMLQ